MESSTGSKHVLVFRLLALLFLTGCGGSPPPASNAKNRGPANQGIPIRDNCYCFQHQADGDRGKFWLWARSDAEHDLSVAIRVFPRAQIDSRTPTPSTASLGRVFRRIDFDLAPLRGATTFRVQLLPVNGIGGESIAAECESDRCR